MEPLLPLLPLVGVLVGWLLTTGRDAYISRQKERATFRKCTFYLLRAWKALLDYERAVTLLTAGRPDVGAYEPTRSHFAGLFMERISEDKDSLQTGIEMLASVDPTGAVQLDNTVKNIRSVLKDDFAELLRRDPVAYVEIMNRHNGLVDWTLSDFQEMAERLAGRCGFSEKRRVVAWFKKRIAGATEVQSAVQEFQKTIEAKRK